MERHLQVIVSAGVERGQLQGLVLPTVEDDHGDVASVPQHAAQPQDFRACLLHVDHDQVGSELPEAIGGAAGDGRLHLEPDPAEAEPQQLLDLMQESVATDPGGHVRIDTGGRVTRFPADRAYGPSGGPLICDSTLSRKS